MTLKASATVVDGYSGCLRQQITELYYMNSVFSQKYFCLCLLCLHDAHTYICIETQIMKVVFVVKQVHN